MISCKKATELISKSLDEELTVKESLSLKIHLFICEFCELFKKQVSSFRKSLADMDQRDSDCAASNRLSVEARSRIKDAIKKMTPGD